MCPSLDKTAISDLWGEHTKFTGSSKDVTNVNDYPEIMLIDLSSPNKSLLSSPIYNRRIVSVKWGWNYTDIGGSSLANNTSRVGSQVFIS